MWVKVRGEFYLHEISHKIFNSMNNKAFLWLSSLLLVLLRWSSSNKEKDLTTNSSRLEWLLIPKRENRIENGIFCRIGNRLILYSMVDNKQPMHTAPTEYWTQPSCIALSSVQFLGLVAECGFVPPFGDDGVWRKSLCTRWLSLLDTVM